MFICCDEALWWQYQHGPGRLDRVRPLPFGEAYMHASYLPHPVYIYIYIYINMYIYIHIYVCLLA